ncbi:hypothetical protein GXW76_19625, partial [Roseomonas soli]|nr:hypothetical protein [Neoroseomonas soli]
GGTLAGAWLRPAAGGRWLVVRDPGMPGPPVEALRGALWDGRFRLDGPGRAGWRIGALGEEAARLRRCSALPASVLRALPAIRDPHGVLAAVPAMDYPSFSACAPFALSFMRATEGRHAGAEFSGGPFKRGPADLMC